MYYIVDSEKSFEQACTCLESAMIDNGLSHDFSALHVHDLGKTLRAKGMTLTPQCKIFEVCHPLYAANILTGDMRVNMLLPCRISVYTDQGKTHIGLIKPAPMLAALSDSPSLLQIFEQAQTSTIEMIDEAK
jgi:uncharacterized protein (DUF302 family)